MYSALRSHGGNGTSSFRCKAPAAAVIVVAVTMWPLHVAAKPPVVPAYTAFRSYPLPEGKSERIRTLLESGKLDSVPHELFGDAYDASLSDLVFYFDTQESTSHIALVRDGKRMRKLHSARNLWALVFTTSESLKINAEEVKWDYRLKTIQLPKGIKVQPPPVVGAPPPPITPTPDTAYVYEAIPDSTKPSVRLEPLAFHRGVVETTVLTGLATILGGPAQATTDPPPKDELHEFELVRLSTAGEKPLYFGYAKLELKERTINRVRAALDERRAYATVPNFTASATGLSLAAMYRAPSFDQMSEGKIEPYLLFHLYFIKPEQPHVKGLSLPAAAGLFGGLGIGEDAFKHFAIGVAVDHLFGELGLVGGFAHHRDNGYDGRERWERGVIFGLSYTL